MTETLKILKRAKAAQREANNLSAEKRDELLRACAGAIVAKSEDILAANARDVESARATLSESMIDRLALTPDRIAGMAQGLQEVYELPDPLGKTLATIDRPNGLHIEKISVPLGVVAIIYESRPNVTSDAAGICLKSGNVCVLRSGKEAYETSKVIVEVMREALEKHGATPDLINIIDDTTRQSANVLMHAKNYIDLLVPRGGKGLIQACVENSTVPCIETGTGICHIYVDSAADQEMALVIIENAKTSRPSVCNAAEVLLVNAQIKDEFMPKVRERLCGPGTPHPVELIEGEFDTEFLDYKMGVGYVANVKEACDHIAKHSTHHSEAIVTQDVTAAEYFTKNVDSTSVYVNASTRFTDGGEFGIGAEMGISTQKLHARGPFGVNELTTYKYIIHGNGQIR